MVRPEEVCEPVTPPRPLVVLECVSPADVECLEGHPSLAPFLFAHARSGAIAGSGSCAAAGGGVGDVLSAEEAARRPELVIHLLDFELRRTPKYLRFLNSFPPETQHLVLDPSRLLPHNLSALYLVMANYYILYNTYYLCLLKYQVNHSYNS